MNQDIVVRDRKEGRLRVQNNVPHELSFSLSRDDVVDAFLSTLPTPLKVREVSGLDVLKEVFTSEV